MQGKHLTQKERFYIEKRHGEGVSQSGNHRPGACSSPLNYQLGTQTQYRPHFQRRLLLQKSGYSGPGAAS